MAFKEVITRRCLPHWFVPGAAHFVTYRLYGSLSESALQELRSRKEALLGKEPKQGETRAKYSSDAHKTLFGIYDGWLDQDTNIRWLAQPALAAMVRTNLYHHQGSKYHLLAYCIMPNHVHVLLHPTEVPSPRGAGDLSALNEEQASSLHHEETDEKPVGEQQDNNSPLSTIMHSLKSYTAHEANKILKRSGTFWQSESYDHWVRDDDELERIVNYIAVNPVKAGLADCPQNWLYCSAHDGFLADGEVTGWLA